MVRDKKASEFEAGGCLPHQVPERVNYSICPFQLKGGRVEWSADWNGQRIKNKLKRDIVPCCPHVQPAAALPPHHSTSLQGWSAGGGARQSWWTHCHPALRHSGKDLKETITLSKCRRPSMKSSLVSVERREHIALNKQIGFGLEYMNKYNLWNVRLPA